MLSPQKEHQFPTRSDIAKKVNTCWFGFPRTARLSGMIVIVSTMDLQGFTQNKG
jgi:hypothetical protein